MFILNAVLYWVLTYVNIVKFHGLVQIIMSVIGLAMLVIGLAMKRGYGIR